MPRTGSSILGVVLFSFSLESGCYMTTKPSEKKGAGWEFERELPTSITRYRIWILNQIPTSDLIHDGQNTGFRLLLVGTIRLCWEGISLQLLLIQSHKRSLGHKTQSYPYKESIIFSFLWLSLCWKVLFPLLNSIFQTGEWCCSSPGWLYLWY